VAREARYLASQELRVTKGLAELVTRLRALQRTHIAFGSPSMPLHPTRRSRRRRGRTWRVSPISTPRRPVRQSWSWSSRKPPGSRPTSGKWAGVLTSVLNSHWPPTESETLRDVVASILREADDRSWYESALSTLVRLVGVPCGHSAQRDQDLLRT